LYLSTVSSHSMECPVPHFLDSFLSHLPCLPLPLVPCPHHHRHHHHHHHPLQVHLHYLLLIWLPSRLVLPLYFKTAQPLRLRSFVKKRTFPVTPTSSSFRPHLHLRLLWTHRLVSLPHLLFLPLQNPNGRLSVIWL